MANTKLTDTQRIVLAAAAANQSGLVLPLPPSLGDNRGTHGIILKSLTERELLTERQAAPGETIWRESDDHGRTTLVISEAGLVAIGVTLVENSATLSVGQSGQQEDDRGETRPSSQEAMNPNDGRGNPQGNGPRAGSKLAVLIALLQRSEGATIPDIMAALDWQAHSIRGAISGALKKKYGLSTISEPTSDRGRVYRIGEAAPSALPPVEQSGADDTDEGEGA